MRATSPTQLTCGLAQLSDSFGTCTTHTCTYQGEEVDDEISMSSESEEGTATQVLVCLEAATVLPSHGIHEVWRQNKWGPLPLEALEQTV